MRESSVVEEGPDFTGQDQCLHLTQSLSATRQRLRSLSPRLRAAIAAQWGRQSPEELGAAFRPDPNRTQVPRFQSISEQQGALPSDGHLSGRVGIHAVASLGRNQPKVDE